MFEQRKRVALSDVLGSRPDDTPAETDGCVVFVHVALEALRADVPSAAARPAFNLERDHPPWPGEVEAPLAPDRGGEGQLTHRLGQAGGAQMEGELVF